MKRFLEILLIAAASYMVLGNRGCVHDPIELTLLELRKSPSSQYCNAIVRAERMFASDVAKGRLLLVTPTTSFEVKDLDFIEDGRDKKKLDAGDVFVVPLQRPDWKFFIREGNEIRGSLNFWENIPEEDRWHLLKSEAMKVAESITLHVMEGKKGAAPRLLPDEWKRVK